MGHDTAEIRRLNDHLRGNLESGIVVITPGVAALGKDEVKRLFQTISTYDNFCRENDPYGEHDVGFIDVLGKRIIWKIDYFDLALNMHSTDPADPSVTQRVITIMLAEEY